MADDRDLIVIVTNSRDATADFLLAAVPESAPTVVRLNTDEMWRWQLHFNGRNSSFRGEVDGVVVEADMISAIYYRRPKFPTAPHIEDEETARWVGSELHYGWGSLLQSVPQRRWMNHPRNISEASYKAEQLVRAQEMGLSVPSTIITQDPREAQEFFEALPAIAKPIGHGAKITRGGETSGVVFTTAIEPEHTNLFQDVQNCPTLFQQRIDKVLDLRVTIVDDYIFPVALHSQENEVSRVDCRRDNMSGMSYTRWSLPQDVSHPLLRLVKSYGLRYAAIDLLRDKEGAYWFLEINPAGQWAWLEQSIGVPISSAIWASL